MKKTTSWIDKIKNFKISERAKNIALGLFAVVIVIIFTKSAINIFQNGGK